MRAITISPEPNLAPPHHTGGHNIPTQHTRPCDLNKGDFNDAVPSSKLHRLLVVVDGRPRCHDVLAADIKHL
jgi:hypothetical protein